MQEGKPIKLLDQNVFARLVRDEAFGRRLLQDWDNPQTGLHRSAEHHLGVHSAVLEALGVRVPLPNVSIPSKLLRSRNPEEIVLNVGNAAQAFFRSSPELKASCLKVRRDEMRGFCHPDFFHIFDACVSQLLDAPGYDNGLAWALTYDFVHKFDYPKVIEDDISNFLVDHAFFSAPSKERNLSAYRLVRRIWLSSYKYYNEFPDQAVQAETAAVNALLRLKDKSDFLDCDLAYFAVFGIREDQGFSRVFSYTRDNPEQVLLRVRMLKGVVESRRRFVNREFGKAFPEDYVVATNGLVAFVSDDGSIYRVENIESIQPLIIVR